MRTDERKRFMYRRTQKKARSALYAKKHEVATRILAEVMMFSKSGRVRRGGVHSASSRRATGVNVYVDPQVTLVDD